MDKKTIFINTKFASEVYKVFLERKYGIGRCCDDELDRYYTQKENCDLGKRILPVYCEEPVTPPEPPVCPPVCDEGAFGTAYFNLLGIRYDQLDEPWPVSTVTLNFPGLVSFTVDIPRDQIINFYNQDDVQFIVDAFNAALLANNPPITILEVSYLNSDEFPGTLGYGFVVSTTEKTDIYNDLIVIELTFVGHGDGNQDPIDLILQIKNGRVSTC
jgi:hypothetical protein